MRAEATAESRMDVSCRGFEDSFRDYVFETLRFANLIFVSALHNIHSYVRRETFEYNIYIETHVGDECLKDRYRCR